MKRLFSNIAQIPGWRTKRKILVIESDDWGSIRMPSNTAIKALCMKGLKFNDPYNKYDSLASEEDLSCLFNVLMSFKDVSGNHPVITANTVMANPDFKKIEESNYTEYHFELFTETLKKYPQHKNSFGLWEKGIRAGVFYPQYHGREHVNIFRWLSALNDDKSAARKSFEFGVFGVRESNEKNPRDSFMRALDFQTSDQLVVLGKNLIHGLQLFEEVFGYKSKSFIAPSYIWNEYIEQQLAAHGVKYLQGITYQYMPVLNRKKLKKRIHYIGQKNRYGQIYLTRNAFFEPALDSIKSIDETLKRIDLAFRWNKPAIIGSHRVNYIGYLNIKNRDENLVLLKELLSVIIKKWPDVEFMTSDELGNLILNN